MDVLNPQVGDFFRVTVFKSHVNQQTKMYANTYELRIREECTGSELSFAAFCIGEFERKMAGTNILFDRIVTSTMTEEEEYDPTNVSTRTMNTSGERSFIAPVALEVALYLKRSVSAGRQGKLFLRGSLAEGEVESPAGDWKLTSISTMQAAVNTALENSSMDNMLENGTSPVQLIMYGKTPSGVVHWRSIDNLYVGGVVTVNLSHRRFKKASA